MKKTVTIALAISLLPAAAMAQAGSASVQVKSSAEAQAGRSTRANASVDAGASAEAPKMSPEARARIEARIAAAAERGLPAEPLHRRLAEGEAKGASEARISAVLAMMEANMQTTQRVFARLGRQATEGEIAAGAEVVAQGASEAQLARVVERADRARGLEVALTTLASLSANGEGVANAIARIEAKLAEGASDDAIGALVNANGAAHGAAHGAHGKAAVGASAAAGRAGADVGAAAAGTVGGVGAAASGAAGGVIRAGTGKP